MSRVAGVWRPCALGAALLWLCAGCISERAGFAAAPDAAVPPPGATFREAVARLGNPDATRPLPGGGFEAVWVGVATRGGAFQAAFWGVRLLRVGRVRTRTEGRRLCFDGTGCLVASRPVGEGAPPWGIVPFGKE